MFFFFFFFVGFCRFFCVFFFVFLRVFCICSCFFHLRFFFNFSVFSCSFSGGLFRFSTLFASLHFGLQQIQGFWGGEGGEFFLFGGEENMWSLVFVSFFSLFCCLVLF